MTGARIIPVSYDATRRASLKSWDRFLVVKPFGRVHMAFGEPIQIPRRISAENRRGYAAQLERVLYRLDHVCAEEVTSREMESCPGTGMSLTPQSQKIAPSEQTRIR
jgi:hypothetical protein